MAILVGQHKRLRLDRDIEKQEAVNITRAVFRSIAPYLSDENYYLASFSIYENEEVGVHGGMIYTDSEEYKYYRVPCEKEAYWLSYVGNNFILVNCKLFWVEVGINKLTGWVVSHDNIVELGK